MAPAKASPQSTLATPAEIADDVQTTMALWQRWGVSTRDAWYSLTGEHRGHVTTAEIYGFMLAWAAKQKPQQLNLDIDEGDDMDWFRSHHGRATDPTWRLVAKRAQARPAAVWAVYSALYDHASQNSERGSIVGFDRAVVADFLDIEEGAVSAIIDALGERKIITGDRIASWEKDQPKREDWSTPRVQAHRERQTAERDETPAKPTETQPKRTETTEQNREEQNREKESKGSSLPPRARGGAPRQSLLSDQSKIEDAEFEKWWLAYPLKRGKNAAREAYRRARRNGIAAEQLVAGIERYMVAKPAYAEIVYPANWLNNRRWEDEGAPAPKTSDPPEKLLSTAATAPTLEWGRPIDWWRRFDPSHRVRAQKWVRSGEWRWAGGAPGQPGCNLDAELAQAAVAERAKRLQAEPAMLLPIAGAGKEGAAAPTIVEPEAQRRAAG